MLQQYFHNMGETVELVNLIVLAFLCSLIACINRNHTARYYMYHMGSQ